MAMMHIVVGCCISIMAAQPDTNITLPSYSVANWWADDKGNHRAVVEVQQSAPAVWVHIPWRRRDLEPERKAVYVFDVATNERVNNVVPLHVGSEYGDIAFQPTSGPGVYHVYYLPYSFPPTRYGQEDPYLPPKDTADKGWREDHKLDTTTLSASPEARIWPRATLVELQACSEFDRFDPMELPATDTELERFLNQYGDRPYLIFPEDRRHNIRMLDAIPVRWLEHGPANAFEGTAQPNEYYVFQVGVYASNDTLKNVRVSFVQLKNAEGEAISADALHCFNMGGVNWKGQPFSKIVNIPVGTVCPLWIGVDVPEDATGTYTGQCMIHVDGSDPESIDIRLSVKGDKLNDRGDSELWRLSRLRWLESTLATDNDVVPPFVPLTKQGNTVSLLNRTVTFDELGLPVQITSNGRTVLSHPVSFNVIKDGQDVAWQVTSQETLIKSPAIISSVTKATATGGGLHMSNNCSIEADGCVQYDLSLSVDDQPVRIRETVLDLPVAEDVATFMMGMGHRGGYRSDTWQWRWSEDHVNNMIWLGDADAGIQLKLLHDTDVFPSVDLKSVGLPDSWHNGGKGRCYIQQHGDTMRVAVRTGSREIKPGLPLTFRFRFLITPFKPLDPAHWQRRIGQDTDKGGNTGWLHHGRRGNPYINYPFATPEDTQQVLDAYRQSWKGLYYTVRELSVYAEELWALRSMGDEILDANSMLVYYDDQAYISSSGGGAPWLQEHLVRGYVPGWSEHLHGSGQFDMAIATTGLSRWHNYYVQGMDYLMKRHGINLLYLDGIGYDRNVTKRIYKVMKRNNPDSWIMLHEGNDFDFMNRGINPAGRHMGNLAYMGDLWFGEFFDYNRSPDYWLVEISGIPFGLMGSMLDYHHYGNPWRGMVFGMTGAWHASQPDIWKLWDSFGIQYADMLGWWSKQCPVQTDNDNIKATVYHRDDASLISIASWAGETVQCRLEYDWQALGMSPSDVQLHAPAITSFQEERTFSADEAVPVEPARGWLLLLQKK